jgi:hypothetical protein
MRLSPVLPVAILLRAHLAHPYCLCRSRPFRFWLPQSRAKPAPCSRSSTVNLHEKPQLAALGPLGPVGPLANRSNARD